MSNVYAITSGEYSGYRVLAVCEDKKTAERWARAINGQQDARVEAMTYIKAGEPPRRQHRVDVIETWWDSGQVEDFDCEEVDEYAIASYRGEAPARPVVRFVRAPVHNGRGGRIEVAARTKVEAMKVYSEQKAMWKSSPATFKVSA